MIDVELFLQKSPILDYEDLSGVIWKEIMLMSAQVILNIYIYISINNSNYSSV